MSDHRTVVHLRDYPDSGSDIASGGGTAPESGLTRPSGSISVRVSGGDAIKMKLR